MPAIAPPPPFRGALLRRSAGLWLLLRAGIVIIGLLLDLAPVAELLFLARPAAGFLILLVVWLSMFDARRRGETLFLADLAVPPGVLVAHALVPPVVAEVLIAVGAAL